MTDMLDTPVVRGAADESGLREQVLSLLSAGQRDAAMQAGRALLRAQPGLRSQRFLRKAAETMLKRHGYEVATAADGEEALRLARSEPPGLMLLDLIMPKMQGFDVLQALKSSPETAGIPVIVLSNLGQDSDVALARERGALDYFVKSNISLEALVERVRTFFTNGA